MYIPLETLKQYIPNNDYNKWVCKILEYIARDQGWEDSETNYFLKFYEEIIDKNFILKQFKKWKSDKKEYAQDSTVTSLL